MKLTGNILTVAHNDVKRLAKSFVMQQFKDNEIDRRVLSDKMDHITYSASVEMILVNIMNDVKLVSINGDNYSYRIRES